MMLLRSAAVLSWLTLLLTIPAFPQLQEPSPPVNVILDAGMAIDADDVGGHAVLWGLANRGEVNVLALICSSANDYSAPTMRVIANYYGHPNVPIGANKASTPNAGSSSTSVYTQQIVNQFGTPGDTRFNYPDAVSVYRQALANAPDNSVYIVADGYYEPLRDLLQSQPDAISPMTGMQLVTRRVRRLVSNAGWFPSGGSSNFSNDTDAASYVFINWPSEIVSVGVEATYDVITGPSTTSNPSTDPVMAAYKLYQQAQGLSSPTTPAFAQMPLLYAIRGGLGTNFSIGGYNGQTTIDDTTDQFRGENFWSATPNAGQSYLEKAISATQMAAIIDPLLQSSSNMPILRSISPTSLPAGSPRQKITLTGTNFFNDSQVLLNGSGRPTTFVSGTQLSVELSSSDLAEAGNQALSVSNSSEGGWQSNTINLNVLASTPTLTSISPSSAIAGSGPITLTATGTNFTGTSAIQVNGATRSTTFVGGTQLTTTLTTTDLATAGSLSITVVTPSGGTSSPLNFTINNPLASLSSISPTSVLAGSSAFALTVNGSNFVSGSSVRVNGAARTTTFVSPTQLTASIPASDIAVGGYLSVTVFNPAPGGGSSPALTLTVNNPLPAIADVSPNPTLAVTSNSTLTIDGSGFIRGSVVQVDGTPRATIFVSSAQLQIQINSADSVGQHSITVFNAAPGGGTSNSVTLTVVSLVGMMAPNLEEGLDVRPEPLFSGAL